MFNDKKTKTLSSSKIDTMPITTILGADIVFMGDMKGDSVVRIDGKVKGNVSLKQGIVLGEKAHVEGDINSDHIVVYGNITGNIICKELIIRNCGVVNGDIQTEIIEIEMGGRYNGKLSMSEPVSKEKVKN
ncbi:MAG: polymer-forming cytoskeletal protein [Dysgonamonadaceae bacterium]|jgi:cytoskeletal protein CcmA (bactofilin family)|nr:polymer-forming cytoskeletal protein [Dysgonamonadaceae bacterium]